MNSPLYLLAAEFKSIAATLADSELDEQTILDTLEGAAFPVEQKAQNVLAVAASMDAEAGMIRTRIEALQARMKALDNRASHLRDYTLSAMLACGITEIKCPDFIAKVKDNPPSVVIDNEAGIPDDCWRVIPEKREPNKVAIKAMLQAGDTVEFAHLERRKSLSIK